MAAADATTRTQRKMKEVRILAAKLRSRPKVLVVSRNKKGCFERT